MDAGQIQQIAQGLRDDATQESIYANRCRELACFEAATAADGSARALIRFAQRLEQAVRIEQPRKEG